jgi:hypothetical protein
MLPEGQSLAKLRQASTDNANEQNYCKMLRDLERLKLVEAAKLAPGGLPVGLPPECLQWADQAAAETHELVHIADFATAANQHLADFERGIEEQVMIDPTCDMDANRVRELLEAHPAWATLKAKLLADINSSLETDDSNGKICQKCTVAAIRALTQRITEIRSFAAGKHWGPCR